MNKTGYARRSCVKKWLIENARPSAVEDLIQGFLAIPVLEHEQRLDLLMLEDVAAMLGRPTS